MTQPSAADDRELARELRGRFLVFEGPDGSGKSTQLGRFVAWARSAGAPVCEVREPGGTAIGERVRAILLDPAHTEMSLRCEMMLYMASRAQLVEERIRPALERGELVVADRYVSSTLAYQGAGGGLPVDEIMAAARAACGPMDGPRGGPGAGCWPDLTIIFDVDEETARKRLPASLDRMEQKNQAFHRKVRAGYLEQARADPSRHAVIDARGSADEVWSALRSMLASRFAPKHAPGGHDPAELLVATSNSHKLDELRGIFRPLGVRVVGLKELPSAPKEGFAEPEETGQTFEANARIKALAYARLTGRICLADDSGLEVDALGGEPGVHSAYYAGTAGARAERDARNNAKLLAALDALPDEKRTGRYVCAICVASPDGRVLATSRGTYEGRIGRTPRGSNGFGYDPLFEQADGRTAAELTDDEKNARSHRGNAARAVARELASIMLGGGA